MEDSATDVQLDTDVEDSDLPEDGGEEDAEIDAGPRCVGPPGLYIEGSCSVLAEGVMRYEPEYWLWSDGTDKDRFVWFPPGTRIDSRTMGEWSYPVGTRFWKTFSLDGRRLETRFIEKTREGSGISRWSFQTFAWSEDESVVTEVTDGVVDTAGSTHDIPSISACGVCHGGPGAGDVVLGFGAVQLNHDREGITLEDLDEMGWLSDPAPAGLAEVPGSPETQEALGYMHSNCGPCHGGERPQGGLNLQVEIGLASALESAAYRTAVGVPSEWQTEEARVRVAPGQPEASTLFVRMNHRNVPGGEVIQMPPIATEFLDDEGLEIVRTWIESIPPEDAE